MPSSQKLPKHHSHNSSTEDSHGSGGRASKPYRSGASVGKGGAKRDPDGGVEMSGPNTSHHKPGKFSR